MRTITTVVLMCIVAMSAMAQNEKESFNPSGKVIMRIFSNFNTTITDGSTTSAFQFERSYFGYQYEFSKELSARVLFDVTVPKEKNQEMTLHVKNAFVKYSRGQFWDQFWYDTYPSGKPSGRFLGLSLPAKIISGHKQDDIHSRYWDECIIPIYR
jgi:hypothetical protein